MEEHEDVMCDSASSPGGLTAGAVMVTSMAVLTTSMTCHTVQHRLGTICLGMIHFSLTYTHKHSDMHAKRKTQNAALTRIQTFEIQILKERSAHRQ